MERTPLAAMAMALWMGTLSGSAAAQEPPIAEVYIYDEDAETQPSAASAEQWVSTGDQAGSCGCCNNGGCNSCCGHCIDWQKVPGSIRKMHRPGLFPIRPTNCGYYSLADALHGTCRNNPGKNGYPPFAMMPPSFFDADFRYLESVPEFDQSFSERLKRLQLTDNIKFSTGGQVWARYMHEHNSRLSANDNEYTLTRARAYGDLLIGDRVRIFGEFLWADALGEDLAPLPIDVNRGDALNLFVEFDLFEYCGKPVYARVGRQELMFGSQRLVSTLDWANTRRTFDGVRIFRTGEQWDVDMFYSAFVPVNPTGLDQLDDSREFAGAWATYRPKKGHFVDFFYLYFENENNVAQQGITRAPTNVHTLGSRYAGDRCGWLWDFWGAIQMGDQAGQDLFAGAATASLGRHFKSMCWSPTLWVGYDYASGDSNPGAGDASTFNQLYPFGHYYLGWIDQVARQNIHDVNAHLYLYPSEWVTLWLQYHHFQLDQSRDALYNAGGVAIRRDATGAAGRDVGDEFDIVMNLHLARNSDLLFGYSHLFGGSFLDNTPGPANAELFYAMFQQRW